MYEAKERERLAYEETRVAGGLGNKYSNQGQAMKATAPYYGEADSPSTRQERIGQRIERALYMAERAMQKAEAAQRAKAIINAHPEFAELLDALNEF